MSENLTPLVAFGGNSHFARSMRVKTQWRDRFGRWIEMGKGVKFKFRRPDGSVVSAKGTYVGATDDPNMGQLYVSKDPNGLKDGFYSINSANAQEILASIAPEYLQQRGIQLGQHEDGTSVSDRLDEAIPNQQDVPYSAAPIGWKVSGGSNQDASQVSEWTTDDGDYVVRPATFPIRQRTGNSFMLYRGTNGGAGRQQPVGNGFKDWSGVLDEVNREDAATPTENPDSNDPWANDPNANAPEVPDAATDAALSPKDRAKAAIKQFDQDGTISNLIDENGKSDDILDALDNNPQWKQDNDDYLTRDSVDSPQQLQKDKWAAHEQQVNAIKALDSSDDTAANPDTTTGNNLDLSVGDVAADGYLIPTEGNLEEHDASESNQLTDLMANYVNGHKDAFAGGGKRLSVATKDDGSFSFDVVDQVSDHNEAQQLASERQVTEIYDVANNKVISTAQGRPRNDGTNADINPNAVESVGNGLDANQPVSGTDGGTDQEQNQPGNDGSSAAEQRPAEPGDQSAPSGDNAGQQRSATTEPAPVSDRREGAGDSSGQRPEAGVDATPAPAAPEQAYDSGLDADGLPEDRASLERMANRMEAKASRMQDDPAVESIETQLDAIYKKMARLDGQDTPERNSNTDTPAPSEPVAQPAPEPQPVEDSAADVAPVPAPVEETPEQLQARAEALRARILRATEKPSVAPAVQESVDAPENVDVSTLSQRVKDAEKRAKTARTKLDNVYKAYGANDIPNNSQYKGQELKAKADLSAARANLRTARDDLDRHLNADPVKAQERAEGFRQAGAPQRAEMPEGFAEGDKVEWGDGNRGTVRRAIVDRNGETRVTVSRDADQANNRLADGNVVNVKAEDLRKPSAEPVDSADTETQDRLDRIENEVQALQEEQSVDTSPVDESTAVEAPATPDVPEIAPEEPTAAPEPVLAPSAPVLPEINPVQNRSFGGGGDNTTRYVTPQGEDFGYTRPNADGTVTAFDPADRSTGVFSSREEAETWLGDRIARRVGVDQNPITNRAVSDAQPDGSVYSGNLATPATSSRVTRLENIAAGKDLTPEQQQRVQNLIENDDALTGQINDMLNELSGTPNRPNTVTRPRENNPANFTTASPELSNVAPGKIADPNRIMQDLKSNHEGYQMLANGDIIVESRNENGNTYDLVVRRTASERFFPYIRETNNETGVSRAIRVGDETHSYKALTTKLNRAKDDLRKDGISRRFSRKRGIENIPANGDFDSVPDPVRDFIEHTNIARTPDEHTNRMADMLANIAVRGDSDTVLRNVAKENNLPDEFVDRIVDAVLTKAQNDQLAQIARDEARRLQEDEAARRSWIPFEGDAPLQVGDWVDWTDYREFIDVNKDTQRPNPNYMRVYRGQVRSLRAETNDGNGDYVYSDSTYVVFPEMNSEANMKPSKQRQRISSQLRKVDSETAPASSPFFAKKEEKQRVENRENVVRDFNGRPAAEQGEEIQTLTRSTPGQNVDAKVDIEGVPYLGDENPVALPANGVDAGDEFLNRQGVSKFADELQPGDMIAIMPNGSMSVRPATVISNDNQEAGRSNIGLAYYDSEDNLVQTNKVVNSTLRFPARVSENGSVPANASVLDAPDNDLNLNVRALGDRVSADDIPGGTGTITNVSAPDRLGEVTYTVRADSNGAEYPRKERYLSDAPSDVSGTPTVIQPVQSATPERLAEPATDKQRQYITDLLAKKQVSTASRAEIRRALTNEDFSKGDASQIITELTNHKDVPKARPGSDAANDAAANVAQGVADDLKRNPNAVSSGQRVQDAVDAATQERALAEYNHNYDGYNVAEIAPKDVTATNFTAISNTTHRDLQVGDLIPKGVGDDKYYWQVVERNGDKYTARLIDDTNAHGTIVESAADGTQTDALRPTPDMAKSGYIRQGPGIGELPMAPNQPGTVNNYQANAQAMLDSFFSGYEAKTLPRKGAMNQGAAIIRTQNGDEYFMKQVRPWDGEAENEVVASIIAHTLGLNATTVVAPDNGTVVSTNVKGDLAASFTRGEEEKTLAALDILGGLENHPNAKKIGLLDYLIGNNDRHGENWMIVDADTPTGKDAVPIDHGNVTWLNMDELPDSTVEWMFEGNPFIGPVLGGLTPLGEGDGLYTKSELIQIRDRIMGQRQAFIDASPDSGLEYFRNVLANINRLIQSS